MSKQSAYEITSERSRLDIGAIHAFLAQTYWAKGIPKAVVERAISNSICFGAFHEGRQVGFGRVVTDRATFGYLSDVFVIEEHRGKGLSRLIMDAVKAHPELQGLRRVLLATRDAHGLYAKYGFKPLVAPERMMEVLDADVYRKTED